MSAALLRQKTVDALIAARDIIADQVWQVRYRPFSAGDGKTPPQPASTPEEIAMQVLEWNAAVRALNTAVSTINAEYQKLVQPQKANGEAKNAEEKPRVIY